MEEVKSLAKWWNNDHEVVMPSLSTSLCMVSGPGTLPLKKLNECLGVHIFHKLVLIAHVKSVVVCAFRRIKICDYSL